MDRNLRRQPSSFEENKTLPKINSTSENPTKPRTAFVDHPLLSKIIQSVQQQEGPTLHHRQSSSIIPSSHHQGYFEECVTDALENSEQLSELLSNPFKYVVYDLINYYLALIGPLVMELQIGAKIGVFVPDQSSLIKYNEKMMIKIQRKVNPKKKSFMEYNYFVYQPKDILFPTLIFKYVSCIRNTMIQSYFGTNCANYYMILGLTGHSVLEGLIKKQIDLSDNREQFFNQKYLENLQQFYLLNISKQTFLTDCKSKFSSIYQFYKKYIKLGQEIEINKWQKQYLKVVKVIGAEYTVKSRIFAMKGKIDLLLQCDYFNRKQNTKKRVMVPFELKTGGKECHTHLNQVHVYNILLKQTTEMDSIGLLFYPVLDKVVPVRSDTMNLHEILLKRNQYVYHFKKRTNNAKITLPKHTGNTNVCGNCPSQKQCVSISLTEVKDIEDLNLIPNYDYPQIKEGISCLTPKSKVYLQKWLNLMHIEEKAQQRQYILCLQNGFNKFKIVQIEKLFHDLQQGIHESNIKLRSRKLTQGDMQLIQGMYKSTQKVRMNIPHVKSSLKIQIERGKKQYDRYILFAKASIRDPQFDYLLLPQTGSVEVEIDKFTINNSFSQLRSAIVDYCMIKDKSPSYRFIVENEASHFTSDLKMKWYYEQNIKQNDKFNKEQKQVIRKALVMKDFSLVEGYPGTGKTFLIVEIVKIFREVGMKVLITSFTNNSLNNILRILAKTSVDPKQILRYGNKNLVSGQFSQFSYDQDSFKTVQQIQVFLKSKQIWMVTLTSLFNKIVPSDFDVIIVEEASQCIEPICLNSITKAKKFILVGDYKQLGPVVIDRYAESQGMRISLFQKLCKTYPEFSTALTQQWRMCSQIMQLANNLVYNNQLNCANSQIEEQILSVDPTKFKQLQQEIAKIVNPKMPIVFLSLDLLVVSLRNMLEDTKKPMQFLQTSLVCKIYQIMIGMGILRDKISIISFFNRSNSAIIKKLQETKIVDYNQGDVLTIDKSQGIDKQCIICLMESTSDHNLLAKDISRLNVSLTRSKSKLIIISTRENIEEIFEKNVFNILSEREIPVTEQLMELILE